MSSAGIDHANDSKKTPPPSAAISAASKGVAVLMLKLMGSTVEAKQEQRRSRLVRVHRGFSNHPPVCFALKCIPVIASVWFM